MIRIILYGQLDKIGLGATCILTRAVEHHNAWRSATVFVSGDTHLSLSSVATCKALHNDKRQTGPGEVLLIRPPFINLSLMGFHCSTRVINVLKLSLSGKY